LWAAADDPRLSVAAAAAIRRTSNDLFLSAASIWEMAIKRSIGKLHSQMPLATLIELGCRKLALRVVDITAAHALGTEQLPFHHRDRFDRLLAAQARTEEMTIVAVDHVFDAYGVKRLW
jgi:PIN domain nuclease of toxin-antitoxin system